MYDNRRAKIVDGRAYTDGDTELYTELPLPRKTPLLSNSSYGLKHMLERDTDIYMTNNQFKDAMLACSFLPVNERELNWHYCISRRSPAFTHVGGTYGGA